MPAGTKRLTSLFVLLGLVLIVTTTASYLMGGRVILNHRQIMARRDASDHLTDMLSRLKDAETAQRGYLLTGEKRYLEPYQQAPADIRSLLEKVQADAWDTPHTIPASTPVLAQGARLEEIAQLVSLVHQKLDELQHSLAAYDSQGPGAAIALVNQGRGQDLMAQIRTITTAMDKRFDAQVDELEATSEQLTFWRNFIYVATALINLGFLTWTARRIYADVVRARQQEAATREGQEQLRLALRAAELGAFSCALPFDRFIWSDKCKEHFWLTDKANPALDDFIAAVHPDDRGWIRAALEQSIQAGRPFDGEFRTCSADGKVRWVRGIGRSFSDNRGQPIRFDGVTSDITQAKAVEEEILAAKIAAENANRSKDQFLAALSHELRTPLTPVLATLTQWERQGVPPELQADVLMIRRNIELEARLIDDLLDLTRVLRDKVILQLEPTDIHALIPSVLQICGPEIESRRINIKLKLEAHRPWATVDSARLQQVLWNILRNAAKFTPTDGQITVMTSDAPDGQLCLQVVDNGIGMDSDTLERIFLPFEQGGRSITRRYGGLGLGLAISKSLVELQAGKLAAASAGKGQGSVFTILLPALSTPPVDVPAEPPAPAASPALSILLVEDHSDTARTMARLLTAMGHRSVTAMTVAEALTAAQGQRFDLLLSDIGLPDGDGLQLANRLGSTMPAIALTGYGMVDDVTRSLGAGFVAHLTKPVNFVQLEKAILSAVKHGPAKGNTAAVTSMPN